MYDFATIFILPFDFANPLDALKRSIENNQDEIMDLNRQQLDRGLDSQGKSLGKYANFSYKGRFQPVDLKLTGDYRNEFSIQIDDRQTEIFSQNWKEAILKLRYGKDINGVPAPLMDNMGEIVRRDFIADYKKQLIR